MKRMWDDKEIVELCKEIHNKLGIECIVVEELPSPENAKKGVIYLVPSESEEESNIYEEYILTTNGFEMIGNTAIDLSNYGSLSGNNTWSGTNEYSNGISFGEGAKINKDASNRIDLQYNNDTRLKIGDANLNVKARIDPDANNTYDLGRSGVAWRNLFLAGILSDGTNSASIADLFALITYAKSQGWIS